MVLGLVFFGVVAAVGVCAVQVGHALRAVFAVAERALGKQRWKKPIHRSFRIKPGTYQPRYRFQLTISVMWAERLKGPHMA